MSFSSPWTREKRVFWDVFSPSGLSMCWQVRRPCCQSSSSCCKSIELAMATTESCHPLSAHVTSRCSPTTSGKNDIERNGKAPYHSLSSQHLPFFLFSKHTAESVLSPPAKNWRKTVSFFGHPLSRVLILFILKLVYNITGFIISSWLEKWTYMHRL